MIALSKKNIFLLGGVTAILISAVVLFTLPFMPSMSISHNEEMYSTEYNKQVVIEKNGGIEKLLADGRYKCCMKEPCFRCFSKPGAQDKELVCDCMVDVYNGKHPCGECIGEILEGEGNPLMTEYFATSIAEELGEQHLATLRQIIFEKYNIPVEKQL